MVLITAPHKPPEVIITATKLPWVEEGRTEPTEEARHRLAYEAKIIEGLHHRNITTVINASTDWNGPWLRYAVEVGESIDDSLVGNTDEGSKWWACVLQVLLAIKKLHDSGIVHGNISASSVKVTSNGTVKLGEFGCAFRCKDADCNGYPRVPGEMRYRAPEWENDPSRVSFASDIFSTGLLIIRIFTNEEPWSGCESNDTIRGNLEHAKEAGYYYSTKPDTIDITTWRVIGPMLDPTPENRPAIDTLIRRCGLLARIDDVLPALEIVPTTNEVVQKEIMSIQQGTKSVVKIRHVALDASAMWALASTIVESTTLNTLILVKNQLAPEQVSLIIEAIGLSTSLRWVIIRKNAIGDKGAKEFAIMLQRNKVLERVCLAHDEIGVEGAQTLVSALQQGRNTRLKNLCLRNNRIGDTLEKEIEEVFESNARTKVGVTKNSNNSVITTLFEDFRCHNHRK